MRLLAGLLACALLASIAQGTNYDCPAATCDALPNCECGSTSPPGGLSRSDVPQFIILTNDDSVDFTTYPIIRNITNRHKNPNGCPMVATWFVQTEFTEADLIRNLYMDNHEIAVHTIHHPAYPNASEILGARAWLNQTANVPLEKLKGFRAPFLMHNTEQRTILRENVFLWDSSITEQFGSGMASPNGGSKIWPFSMDYGIPIDCTVGTGSCNANEVQPGLWEFPLWSLQAVDGSVIASMDPTGDNFAEYQLEFQRNYNGNRAPLGLYLHAGLLMAFPEHQGQINAFLEWALTHEDVWLVTVSEVIRWMKNPMPASQYKLDCSVPTDMVLPGGKFCPVPSTGCGQGTWNEKRCACDCLYEFDASSPGYCPDASGVCTVGKPYDTVAGVFKCPGENSTSGGRDGSSSAPAPYAMPSPSPSDQATNMSTIIFKFFILGSSAADIQANKTAAICQAVAQVGLLDPSQCTVAKITNVNPWQQQTGQRLCLELSIFTSTPDKTQLALQAAAQYGALATALSSAGIKFDFLGNASSAAPAPAPATNSAHTPSGGSSSSSGGSNTGTIIGGVMGGVVGAILLVMAVFVVLRWKRQRAASHAAGFVKEEAKPSKLQKAAGGSGSIAVRVSSFDAAHATGYNASPRSITTPRHVLARHSSGEAV